MEEAITAHTAVAGTDHMVAMALEATEHININRRHLETTNHLQRRPTIVWIRMYLFNHFAPCELSIDLWHKTHSVEVSGDQTAMLMVRLWSDLADDTNYSLFLGAIAKHEYQWQCRQPQNTRYHRYVPSISLVVVRPIDTFLILLETAALAGLQQTFRDFTPEQQQELAALKSEFNFDMGMHPKSCEGWGRKQIRTRDTC